TLGVDAALLGRTQGSVLAFDQFALALGLLALAAGFFGTLRLFPGVGGFPALGLALDIRSCGLGVVGAQLDQRLLVRVRLAHAHRLQVAVGRRLDAACDVLRCRSFVASGLAVGGWPVRQRRNFPFRDG